MKKSTFKAGVRKKVFRLVVVVSSICENQKVVLLFIKLLYSRLLAFCIIVVQKQQ